MKRVWIRYLAIVAGLIALALPVAATARTTPSASTTPINHVVVIYLENHSFDSLLGFWCDQNPGRCPDGGMPQQVTLSNGVTITPAVDPDTVPMVTHNRESQLAAMNIIGGVPQMNGWQNINGSQGSCGSSTGYVCVSGYTPNQIPNITGLATAGAISDATTSMVDSPSWVGHMYAVAASSDGFINNSYLVQESPAGGTPGWGCDSNKESGWQNPATPGSPVEKVPSCVPKPDGSGAFEATPVSYLPTIMDRLDAAGLSWKLYGAVAGERGYGQWDICPTFAQCLDGSQVNNMVSDSQFTIDATAGTLPAFSVITPGGNDFGNSCHNGTSITACDNWVGQLMSDLQTSPDWSSTTVFITWDDFGGFYDQYAPSINPDGSQQGPRVPLIIAGPYVKAGYTDTTPTTFAGILAYTEHNFGLAPLGPNDQGAYDFSDAFNYAAKRLERVHMVTRRLPLSARHLDLSANGPAGGDT